MSVDLSDIKVGDTVFVVMQKRKHSQQEPGFSATVISVGRRYATCQSANTQLKRELKFDRKTGVSVHPGDHNVRANYFGWDVYRDEPSYEKHTYESIRLASLHDRIVSGYGARLKSLPPEAVEAIHAILDKHE